MSELFAGTASYYRRYRPQYPLAVFDWIVAQHRLDGAGRLLDCGCGTGGVFVGLARWFSHTIAMDPDGAMLAMAREVATENSIEAITFLQGKAEDLPFSVAPLRMVTFGAAFHWIDRVAVARRLDQLIEPGGAIVILSPSSLWSGRPLHWKTIVIDTIKRWLGEERRAGAGIYGSRARHQECLMQTPFSMLTERMFVQPHVWRTDDLLGYLFSTSYASRAVLGDRADAFERDLRDQLVRLSPNGVFEDEIEYSVISARRA